MMTRTKHSLLILLALFLTVGLSVQSVWGTAKISEKSLTLKTKQTATLKVKGTKKKASWKVTGPKLVRIKAKGRKGQSAAIIAGTAAGTCTIKVRVGRKTLKCKVTVKKVNKKPGKEKPGKKVATPIAKGFVQGMSNTSVDLLKQCAGDDGNVLISPDSILTAMTMAENGAKGKTRKEMEGAFGATLTAYNQGLAGLHKRLAADRWVSYHPANAIWYREGAVRIRDTFRKRVGQYHDAEIRGGAFDQKTVKEINGWVKKNTHNMIPSIVDRLDPQARIALLNATAFEGKWADQYRDGAVVKGQKFTNEDGSIGKVTMLEGAEHTYLEVAGGTGFLKYYEGGQLAFLGLLPPENLTVDEYVEGLSGAALRKGWKSRKTSGVVVRTRMPEFKYDYFLSLNKALQNMGVQTAFTGNADFSAMANPAVCIDEVLHKTHIELNRNGTKAAAATMVLAKATAFRPAKVYQVSLDRPFVYAIVDGKTGLPLFLGVVKKQ